MQAAAPAAAQLKTGFAYENLTLSKAVENAMGHSCTMFCTEDYFLRAVCVPGKADYPFSCGNS